MCLYGFAGGAALLAHAQQKNGSIAFLSALPVREFSVFPQMALPHFRGSAACQLPWRLCSGRYPA